MTTNFAFSDEEYERYCRQILLPSIGLSGQEKLRKTRILVIGAGGLGAPLLQQFAAAGLGHIGLVDPDIVSLSNLNRQILYKTRDIGRPKVEAALQALRELNPYCTMQIWQKHADRFFLEETLSHYDLVCDGTDTPQSRIAISDACVAARKVLVSGSAQGFSGQYAVFRPCATIHDTDPHHPNWGNSPCYRCLFPDADDTPIFNCSTAGRASIGGIIGPVTTIIAGFMAMEAFRQILQLDGADAPAKLTLWDGLSGSLRSFIVPYNPHCLAQH